MHPGRAPGARLEQDASPMVALWQLRAGVGSTAEQCRAGRWEEHLAGRAGASQEEEEVPGRICALGRWCEHGRTQPGWWRQWKDTPGILRLATAGVGPGSGCSLYGN